MNNNTAGPVFRSLRTRKAFTLIELLVTVTIISIVSAVAISPFSLLSRGMETKERSDHIGDMIRSLDESIENSQSSSYEVVFTTGSVGFVTDQDWYRQKNRVSLDFDFVSHSGVLRKINTFTGIWMYKVLAQDNHVIIKSSIDSGGTEEYFSSTHTGSTYYKITNTLDNAPLESFLIRYYDLPGTTDIAESPTRLVSIESTLNGTTYTSLKVRNINGTRMMMGSGATLDKLMGVKLVFEKNGTEMVTIIGEMR